jgi:enoyl-CoA hydratase/carnithine racemase
MFGLICPRGKCFERPPSAGIGQSIKELRANDRIRCIILEAAGDCFSAGRDLHNMRESEREKFVWGNESGTAMGVVRALRNAPQITIARVQGYCLGGGLVLMSGCDLAIVAEDAKIGMPEICAAVTGARRRRHCTIHACRSSIPFSSS